VAGIEAAGAGVAAAYEACEFAAAVRAITAQADALNQYMEREKPWETVKTDPERARAALTAALNGVRLLAAYLGPVLPRFAEKVGRLLGVATPALANLSERVEDRTIGPYERIAERLDPAAVEAVIEETKAEQAAHLQD
jgi:methionyl-tRNA synthetase